MSFVIVGEDGNSARSASNSDNDDGSSSSSSSSRASFDRRVQFDAESIEDEQFVLIDQPSPSPQAQSRSPAGAVSPHPTTEPAGEMSSASPPPAHAAAAAAAAASAQEQQHAVLMRELRRAMDEHEERRRAAAAEAAAAAASADEAAAAVNQIRKAAAVKSSRTRAEVVEQLGRRTFKMRQPPADGRSGSGSEGTLFVRYVIPRRVKAAPVEHPQQQEEDAGADLAQKAAASAMAASRAADEPEQETAAVASDETASRANLALDDCRRHPLLAETFLSDRYIAAVRGAARHPNALAALVAVKHRNGIVDVDAELGGTQLSRWIAECLGQPGRAASTARLVRQVAAQSLLRQLLLAVVYFAIAHDGLQHQSISPATVLVEPALGLARLTPFGVTDLHEAQLQLQQQRQLPSLFSSAFCAPEARGSLENFLRASVCDTRLAMSSWSVARTVMAVLGDCADEQGDDADVNGAALRFILRRMLVEDPRGRLCPLDALALTYLFAPLAASPAPETEQMLQPWCTPAAALAPIPVLDALVTRGPQLQQLLASLGARRRSLELDVTRAQLIDNDDISTPSTPLAVHLALSPRNAALLTDLARELSLEMHAWGRARRAGVEAAPSDASTAAAMREQAEKDFRGCLRALLHIRKQEVQQGLAGEPEASPAAAEIAAATAGPRRLQIHQLYEECVVARKSATVTGAALRSAVDRSMRCVVIAREQLTLAALKWCFTQAPLVAAHPAAAV